VGSKPLILPTSQAFAPDLAPPRWFSVAVRDHGHVLPQQDKKIVFHGINKSGSLCLAKVIRDAYAKAGRMEEIHSHYHSQPWIELDKYLDLFRTTRPPGFFIAHYLFWQVPFDDPELIFITQFRHPLTRHLSIYEWLRKRHILGGGTPQSYPGFEEYVRAGAGKRHAQIVHFSARYGENFHRLQHSLTPEEMFERSIQNIERHVYFAGISELFEETIFVVAHICGLRNVSVWKRDERNVGRPMSWTLEQKTIDLVHEVYRYDFKLYDWVKRRFQGLLDKISLGGDFEAYRLECNHQYKDRLLSTDPRAANQASAANRPQDANALERAIEIRDRQIQQQRMQIATLQSQLESTEHRFKKQLARLDKWSDCVLQDLGRVLKSNRWRVGCWLSLKPSGSRSKEARRLAELVARRPRQDSREQARQNT
jgi:hypothetical protein